MDQSDDWLRKRKKGEEEGRAPGRRADGAKDTASASAETGTGTPADDDGTRLPLNPNWNSYPETSRWLANDHFLASASDKLPWCIQGWLAGTGTSVWYGAGSTGKTQLMLWMAAMVASSVEDGQERTWMGAKIHGTGHVLVLTAEDTLEQIMNRLRDVVTHTMGQDGPRRVKTLKRLHVMPFLSMSKRDFDHPNPSLFEQDKTRVWGPSPVMHEIERYILEWNRLHPDDNDRIIGVVMDSATSMAGFDSLDAPATTNFFFYLGRLCERLRIFWAVIGHTPKVTSVPRYTARETATSRLRGVAMWTTAPRLTVEVRLIQEWKKGGKIDPEAGKLRDWLGKRVSKENILVVYVAKANLQYAAKEERYLVRAKRGAFIDVTDMPDDVLHSGVLDPDPDEVPPKISSLSQCEPADGLTPQPTSPSQSRSERAPRGRPRQDEARFKPGTEVIRGLLIGTYAEPRAGCRVSANRLMTLIEQERPRDPRAALVTSASGGGKLPARPGAINWHLDQLAVEGILQKRERFYFFTPPPSSSACELL